ncbi:filamentous hemagglutinin N-terminal domain-containing protein [Tolypothrix sp. VBCCA 56010]|uniref:two-partner secretion domain-containing protein n=1 Tax=Tolypothrix sp. VBCCA 56010 TaxID=3137731 RepID=UPI003D7EF1DE
MPQANAPSQIFGALGRSVHNAPYQILFKIYSRKNMMKLNWKTLFFLTACCTLGLMTTVRAQVSSDGTLSTNVTSPDNLNFTINNGNRVGGNLFHSFREFSVPNNGSAVFQNSLDVQNIISRVTGGSLSQINGLIQSQGSANLFLLNPAGIFFGPNARLNIGGSFFATTADSFLFENGLEFSATNPQAPLLTVNIPIGLRFRDNPGNITNQSVVQDNTNFTVGLQVNPGKSLALVGGNVSLEQGGSLTAAGGRIELGGLAGAGTVGLDTTGNTFKLNFPANSSLSNISLADEARVAVRGNGGGDIAVNANIFTATNGGRLAGGVEGIATRNGGNITVNSNDIFFDGVSSDGFTGIFSQVQENAVGNANAGGIDITTKNLSLTNGAQISASTLGTGDPGNVKIQASDISLNGVGSDGFSSGIFSTVQGNSVNPSGIDITTQTLSLTNGAQINASTFATGDAGRIKIQASDSIKASGVGSNDIASSIRSRVLDNATGNAGGIDITTKNLSFTNGAQITASTLGTGDAGNVKIQASDISFDGVGSTGFSSGIFSSVRDDAIGNAGGIDITTKTLSLTNGAVLSAGTSGNGNAGNVTINASDRVSFAGLGSNGVGSGVYSLVESGASGDGGNITINAASIFLDDRAVLITTNASNGFAGDITLNARDQVSITNNSTISSDGNLGRIFIGSQSGRTDALSLIPNIINIDNSTLNTTNNSTGFAGNIILNARDQVSITNSKVSSEGNLGNIFIGQSIDNAPPVVPSSININNSTVSTTNSGTTFAGDIALNARDQVSLNQSTIKSNGNFGFIFIGKNDTYGDRTSSPRVVKLEGSSLSATNDNITGADDTPFNAGNISIDAIDSISLNNQSFIQALTGRRGNAGNVTLRTENGDISLASGSIIFSTVESGGTGNAGKIDVITRNFSLTDGSELQTLVRAGQQGDAGNITVQASGNVSFSGFNNIDLGGNSGFFPSGIFSQVQSGATGSGGDIKITAKNLSLNNSAQINASTFGIGNAGNVSVRVDDAIALANSSYISSIVGRGGEGIGGDIDIRGRSLTLTGGSQIGTVLFREGNGLSGGKGRAGNIEINATDFVNIFGVGTAGFSSGLFASAERGTTAISPEAAGNINLTTGDFRIADGAVVNALTFNSGDAGNITINAKTFTATGGGQVITTTGSSGSAGNINLNIRDRITISGSDPNYNQRVEGTFDNQGAASGIFANTASGSTGNGGNITILPLQNSRPRIAIADGGEVRVDSLGQGVGGKISIQGNSLTLDRGTISASTASADGGNIDLSLRNFLRLQNESLISANAGGQQGGGNGGNITIDTPFIVAFPRNNDITANAGSGSGGQVKINATLFGIAPLSAADLRRLRPNDLDPRQLPTSDITAISRDNPSLSDNVLVTSPDVDPSRGLVELPETVTDPTQQIAQNPCQQGIGNEFVVTGRGGFPFNPNQTLSSDNVRVDLLQPVASTASRSATIKAATNSTATRVPAQGWIFNEKGQVVLTAYDPTNTGSQRPLRTAACPAR